MKVLAIGAHPDDIEIGCGGTLLHLKHKCFSETHLLLLSDGGVVSDKDADRRKEQSMSCDILGVDSFTFAELKDTEIQIRPVIETIERLLKQHQPDYVFTHYHKDTHQDHRTTATATISACRTRTNLIYYESLSTEDFQPTLLVDISDTFSQKCEAIRMHKSQADRLDLENVIRTLATYRAQRIPVTLAEGFTSRKLMLFEKPSRNYENTPNRT